MKALPPPRSPSLSQHKHSPVFRIGGDEFAVILTSSDFAQREALLQRLKEESIANQRSRSGPVVACGMAVYDPGTDIEFSDVFERADNLMYENKNDLYPSIDQRVCVKRQGR